MSLQDAIRKGFEVCLVDSRENGGMDLQAVTVKVQQTDPSRFFLAAQSVLEGDSFTVSLELEEGVLKVKIWQRDQYGDDPSQTVYCEDMEDVLG